MLHYLRFTDLVRALYHGPENATLVPMRRANRLFVLIPTEN